MNGNVDFYYINEKSDNPALSNKNFRLALNYALDRNSYNELANNGIYTPVNGLVFPGLTENGKTYGDNSKLESYPLDGDKDKANEYLKAAMSELGVSKPSDISVEITTTDAESSKKIAEVTQELWQKALGIKVTIRQVTYAEIYGTVLPGGDYEIGYGGWGADYDDPYSYLELFKSDSSYNYSKYKNDEVDKLLAESRTELDTTKRMEILHQIEQLLIDDGAFVPMQARNVYYMIDDDVKDVSFYFCSLNIDWVHADIKK